MPRLDIMLLQTQFPLHKKQPNPTYVLQGPGSGDVAVLMQENLHDQTSGQWESRESVSGSGLP